MNANGMGVIAAVFALVGVGVGLVGAVATGWAETALATAATGETARFGPVFVAQTYLAVTAASLVVAPVIAGVLGVLVGSQSYDASEAVLTCGGGAGLGALAYGLAVVVLVVASQGEAAAQAHGIVDALGPLAATAAVAAAVGAVAGAIGSVTG
ncbi:hypothetical protein C461_09542 [Halorubrum aidingense JCM 13560]|uniref:Uncharacterized protein n=1 Tax=Halorubrum aidingense JCM 13560 TaxID=1230454 RepID=M0PAG0_9EURY|nr:hypothetical protein [Halorubrum aidingense]EMA66991.1 hypothetical protein C461_09542 [Halorubrum aidingense JCM 13560]